MFTGNYKINSFFCSIKKLLALVSISSVVRHPEYRKVGSVSGHDYALIRLLRGIDLTRTAGRVMPICWEQVP